MAEFDVTAFGAGFVSNLLGGWLNREAAEDRQNANADAQREFAQHGIQWRVEDAARAGVHPLYALGGSGASFAPGPISIQGDVGDAFHNAGQNLSRAAMSVQTDVQRQASELGVRLLSAQVETEGARAALLRAQTGKLQAPNPPFPDMGGENQVVGGQSGGGPGGANSGEVTFQGQANEPYVGTGPRGVHFDRYTVKPGEVESRSSNYPSNTAGAIAPHWKSYQLDDDVERPLLIDLPAGSSPSEAWESLGESWTLLAMTLQQNIRKYGKEWMERFFRIAPHLKERVEMGGRAWNPSMYGRFRDAVRDISE